MVVKKIGVVLWRDKNDPKRRKPTPKLRNQHAVGVVALQEGVCTNTYKMY